MNKFCKIFVSIVYSISILSTTALFADSENRKKIVNELDSLGMVVNFLYDLYNKNMYDFQKLFDYVASGKGDLSYNFAVDLRDKKLIKSNDTPSEKLARTFGLLKELIDDYNKENKDNCFKVCCKKCCCGCFDLWREEHGKGKLDFTQNNVVVLLAALSSKEAKLRPQENVTSRVEDVLSRLSTNSID